MSSVCGREITSEEYADVISSYRLGREEIIASGVNCINVINENWAVLTYPLAYLPNLNFGSVGYFQIPKLFALMDTTSMDASGITRLTVNPNLNYTGKGVLIGIVDTGINYAHPVFLDAIGKTRLQAIWDQNGEGDSYPADIGYGRVYLREEINEALLQENPYRLVPGDEENGHGTFLAGIAAGNNLEAEFTGAASNAELAVVKLKPAKQYLREFYKINPQASAYSETDIMFGIKYLYMLAERLSKPLVILIGLGSSTGPHNGATPLGNYLADISRTTGVAVVTAAGNEGNGRRHYEGNIQSKEEQEVEINVEENERGFLLELWSENPNVLTVGVISPSGEEIPRIPAFLDGSSQINFIFEPTKITVDYKIVETLSGKFLVTLLFDRPSAGIWRIRIYGSQVLNRNYNMWLPVGEFLREGTFFLNSNPNTTLTSPGSAVAPITVAAYDHYGDSIDIHSGRGYNSDGTIKPDLAAPGVNVYGPVELRGFGRRSGSSIAAAHVAGCTALLMEWGIVERNQRYLNTVNIKNYLIKGAKRSLNRMYPDRYWGYGILDIYNVFESLRNQ